MNSLRLQNDASIDDDSIDSSDSDVDSSIERKAGKGLGRPGRPRGKGRPKRSSKVHNKKKSEDEDEWQQKVRIRERTTPGKQQSSIEGYIKIIDFLKKIDYDEGNIQNKMNPYNALTATCFWYAISAEYFSLDFFSKKNPHDGAVEILDRVQRLPLMIPNRVAKSSLGPPLLSFQNEEVNHLGIELGEKMNNLVQAPLPSRLETIERKIPLSSVSEDDQFISSTRSILYNYISKKIKNSDKWTGLIASYARQLGEVPSKSFVIPEPIEFQKEEEPYQETNLFELLRQQAKKKIQKREKNKVQKVQNQNDIFHEDSNKDNQPEQIVEEEQKNEEVKQQNMINQKIEFEVEKEQKQQIKDDRAMDVEVGANEENGMKIQEGKSELKIEQQVRQYIKTYNNQDLILDALLHMPLQKVISILQSSLPTLQLPQIADAFMPIPTQDPLEFVFQLHPEEEKYLQYMKAYRKKKYRQKVAMSEVTLEDEDRQGQYEDAKCQICTDGDYTDDNLIVFCSMCNISLHQRCVGLAKVPAESWVCEVCQAFGPAGINLPCPLCNVKGGAMKRTSIHIDTNLFKQLNPGYYEYSKKCPYNKQKEEYVAKEKIEGEQDPNLQVVRVVRQRGQKEQQCYYDYFVKSTYPADMPTCHYIWVHYVCAIWVPECYFEQKNGVISIKGIENIEKRRFKNECFACKKNKCGAAVKCEDSQCDKYYHPECARKKKVYMEQLNLQKLKYLIFCEEHEPLKLTRQIEYKKKKAREQIIKFARMIEKYIETYRIAQFPFKLMKSAAPSNFIQTVVKVERDEHKENRMAASNSDETFLKELMSNLGKAKMMTVHLEKVETGYKITNIETPSKRQIRKCLNRYDQFWNSIKNGDSNQDNFRRYQRIMLDNQKLRQKLELFLNGNLSIRSKQDEKKQKRVGRKRGKHAVQQIQTLIQQQGGIFCVCKKPYEGEPDMFECEVCGEWYHFKCIGFIGSEEEAQQMEFTCMKCMKFQESHKKQERLEKYANLFSPDSILFNYRPPTPDLQSEEQVQHKNYEEIMEEVKKNIELKGTPQKQKIESIIHKQKSEEIHHEELVQECKQVKQNENNIVIQNEINKIQAMVPENQQKVEQHQKQAQNENAPKIDQQIIPNEQPKEDNLQGQN